MRARGNLLEQMALAGAAWTQLDQVVVALYERNHAHKADQSGAAGQCRRLEADATQQESFPFLGREFVPASLEGVQHISLGKLDGTQGIDSERSPAFFLGDRRVVAQGHLRMEAVREHPLVPFDEVVVDTHVLDREARQLGDKGVRLRVQLCPNDVDQLD